MVKRMVRDLHIPVEIEVGEIIREEGKLALSSRNVYLSPSDRKEAQTLSSALDLIRAEMTSGTPWETARIHALEHLRKEAPSGMLDYLEAVDTETFQKVTSFDGVDSITVVAAVRFGSTRLLDNIVIQKG